MKTSTYWTREPLGSDAGDPRWKPELERACKVLDPSRCDSLFVHVGDGGRWYIPAKVLGGCTHIVLGGPKYAEYEVEAGEPLQARPPSSTESHA